MWCGVFHDKCNSVSVMLIKAPPLSYLTTAVGVALTCCVFSAGLRGELTGSQLRVMFIDPSSDKEYITFLPCRCSVLPILTNILQRYSMLSVVLGRVVSFILR